MSALTDRLDALELWLVQVVNHAHPVPVAFVNTLREIKQALSAPSAIQPTGDIPQPDARTYQAFWSKYALGSKSLPSCFRCGQAKDRDEWAITHAELPDIYLCTTCAAAPAPAQEPVAWLPSLPPVDFVEYMAKNYSANTIISDAIWHAPRIWRAAIRALEAQRAAAAPVTHPPEVRASEEGPEVFEAMHRLKQEGKL